MRNVKCLCKNDINNEWKNDYSNIKKITGFKLISQPLLEILSFMIIDGILKHYENLC